MEHQYFTISHTTASDIDGPQESRVRLAGELDYGIQEQLQATLLEIIADSGSAKVIVDLTDVTFIDSEAINALLHGYTAAAAVGIDFRVIHANGVVRRVLAIVGLLPLFEGEESPGP